MVKKVSKKKSVKTTKTIPLKNNSSKKFILLLQALSGIVLGLLLSLIVALFYSGSSALESTPFSLLFAFSITFGIPLYFFNLGVYPIGNFLGAYFFGKKLNIKGSLWLSLSGLFLSIILFVFVYILNLGPFLFWFFTIILPPVLITWGYYRFGLK